MTTKRRVSLYIMAALYIVAGVLHFAIEPTYEGIVPPYIPYHKLMVYISGACELLFGALLLPAATRRVAAWLIILLLVAVFPANIQMAIDQWPEGGVRLVMLLLRLPLQILLVWWAYGFARYRRNKV